MTKNRLEAFSDGVFSIAITLLILNVKIPQADNLTNSKLLAYLYSALPNIFTFLFSFLVIGVFWVAHHRIFAFVKVVDSTLLWMNVFYLMFVAIIPFPAGLLAKYPSLPAAILVYACTLFTVSVMHLVLLRHIYQSDKLKEGLFKPDIYRSSLKLALVGPVCYVAAAIFSHADHYISFILILCALIFYIFFAGKSKVSQELVDDGIEKAGKKTSEDDEA
jgi:uncharacterized membrane protein